MKPLRSVSILANASRIFDYILDAILIVRSLSSPRTYLTLVVQSFPQPGELSEVDPQVAIQVGCVDQSSGFSFRHLPTHLGYQILQFLGTNLPVAISIKQFKCLKFK